MTVTVIVENGNVDKALKQLRKLRALSGLDREIRKRVAYVKPSIAKRRKSSLARKRMRRVEERRQERLALACHPKDRIA